MITNASALSAIPPGLRDPLLAEYAHILQQYLEHHWLPSELSGGRFSEIVYTILDGHAKNAYMHSPTKPANFVDACKKLEKNSHVPRSFQILIPRLLPALYEVRNYRNVGHVGGDVNPNPMDASMVVSTSSWIMGELVRVFHQVSVEEAQEVVNTFTTRKIPLVWEKASMKRVLNPKMRIKDQILLLLGISPTPQKMTDLIVWTEYKDKKYFLRLLRSMHGERLIEFSNTERTAELLPPGTTYVEEKLMRKTS